MFGVRFFLIVCLFGDFGILTKGNFYNYRRGLKFHVNVTSILDSAYLNFRQEHDRSEGNERYGGFLKELMEVLAERVKFTYSLNLVKDSRFGNLQDENSWNGMIGEILRNEADMAVSSMTINSLRAKYVDFSTAFVQLRLLVLMKKPNSGLREPSLNSDNSRPDTAQFLFLRPMTWPLWTFTIIAIVSSIGFIYFVEWAVHNRLGFCRKSMTDSCPADEPPPQSEESNFRFSLLEPRTLAGKLMGISLTIFITILISAYIAQFYDFGQMKIRKVYRQKQDIFTFRTTTLENLAFLKNNIKFSVIANGSTANYLKKSSNPTVQKIQRKITEEPTLVKSIQDGVNLVASSGNVTYAFITEELTAKYLASRNCDLFVATQPFGPRVGFGVALPKYSPYLKPINLAIAELKDNDELGRLEKRWFLDSGKCHGVSKMMTKKPMLKAVSKIGRNPVQLDMRNTAGIFYIWLFMLAIVGIAAFVEIKLEIIHVLKGNGRNIEVLDCPDHDLPEDMDNSVAIEMEEIPL